MVAARISPFGGMVPAVDDSLLAPINAALAEDTWTYSGAVVGLPVRKVVRNMTDPFKTKVYRIPNNYVDADHLSDSVWMEFSNSDTDVLRTQVVGDTFDRYYWASPLDQPRYMTLAQIQASAPALAGAYLLGVPKPGTPTSGGVSGGASATLKNVAYVQTFVTAYGEEGPPSNPLIFTAQKIDAAFVVIFAQPAPADIGTNRNITKIRLYRTVTATNGTTTYFFVTEVVQSTVNYLDNCAVNTDAVIALNAQLESTNWSGPPADLQGWVSMTNGIVAGFRNNEIWFCEPFRMHAWPSIYTLAVEYPIVGLGVQNNSLVVCTEGFTYIVNGSHPSSMSLQKIAGLMPCTSRGSIVSTTEGVYFSSPVGLALVTSGGMLLATKELIRKDKWNALTQINTLRAAMLGQAYYAFGQSIPGVFQADTFQANAVQAADFEGARNGMLVDPTSKSVAFNRLTSNDPITNIQVDVWSGEIFVIQNGQVQWLDISDVEQVRAPYVWRSKIFQTPKKDNFNVAKIFFTVPPNTVALNATEVVGMPPPTTDWVYGVNCPQDAIFVDNDTVPPTYWKCLVPHTAVLQPFNFAFERSIHPNYWQVYRMQGVLLSDQWGIFKAYADGVLVMVRELRRSGTQFRLPSGFKADFWQFEVEARVQVDVIQVATSSKELAGV